MRKAVFVLILVCLAGFGAAMCPVVFSPPNSFIHLTTDSQGLLVYDEENQRERLVVRQAYEGVASDFGLVLPTPSEPRMEGRSDKLFEQLNEITKEPEDRGPNRFGGVAESFDASNKVQVIKEKQVGDFNATVLKADNAESLKEWLNENGFEFGNRSEENFRYYVEQDQDYYFTALKVNVNEASCLTKSQFRRAKNSRFRELVPDEDQNVRGRCWLRGGLQPLEFSFKSKAPILPIRIMAKPHDESPMTETHQNHDHEHENEEGLPPGNYLVYTLSDQPLTVSGAKVQYSQKLEAVDNPLSKFNPEGKYLVRQRIKFNAHEVEHDLKFKQALPFFVGRDQEKVVNPDQRDVENGMMQFKNIEPKKISFSKKPSAINYLSYKTSRETYRVNRTFRNFSNALSESLSIILWLIKGVPSILLLLLVPLIIGIFWAKGKAAKVTFYGLYIAMLVQPLLMIFLMRPNNVLIFFGIGLIAGLPFAAFSSLIAVASSHILGKIGFFKELHSVMENLDTKKSLGALIASTYLGTASLLLISFLVGYTYDSHYIWEVVGFGAYPVSILIILSILYKRKESKSEKRDRWKKFTLIMAGLLITSILVLTLLIQFLGTGPPGVQHF